MPVSSTTTEEKQNKKLGNGGIKCGRIDNLSIVYLFKCHHHYSHHRHHSSTSLDKAIAIALYASLVVVTAAAATDVSMCVHVCVYSSEVIELYFFFILFIAIILF